MLNFLKRGLSWKKVGTLAGIFGLGAAGEAAGLPAEVVFDGQTIILIVWIICQTAIDIVGMVRGVEPHQLPKPTDSEK